jgi:hypothetical protein
MSSIGTRSIVRNSGCAAIEAVFTSNNDNYTTIKTQTQLLEIYLLTERHLRPKELSPQLDYEYCNNTQSGK